PYGAEKKPPLPSDYAAMVRKVAAPLGVRLVFEPGRMIVGNAGILVAKTLYVKDAAVRRFLILDAAMNDLIRPALYDAYHEIIPVQEPDTEARIAHDVVGPVCETGDTFARGRDLPPLSSGDLVAIMSAGAYGAVQSSEYNTRPLAPEVLVRGDAFSIIRPRPDVADMIDRDVIPNWL
ncbi:MAG: diaminopimelate decarboxylase, partial [Pseudomonadota bacterium]